MDQLKHYKTNFYNSNTKNQIYRLGYTGRNRPLMVAVSKIVAKKVPPKTMIFQWSSHIYNLFGKEHKR